MFLISSILILLNISGTKIGDVAAIVPDPDEIMMASKSTKYVTANGIEVSLDTLKDQMNKENEKEQRSSSLKPMRSGNRRKFKRNRLSCHTCQAPDCSDPGTCDGATSCYTSQLRDNEGNIQRSKGN